MTTIKEMICVNCPVGCHVRVSLEDGKIQKIEGNTCPRGADYARQETICPMRILTSTVRIERAASRVLPVITEKEIPLSMMQAAMAQLRTIVVTAPVQEKDVLCEDLAGTGVRLIASRSMDKVS